MSNFTEESVATLPIPPPLDIFDLSDITPTSGTESMSVKSNLTSSHKSSRKKGKHVIMVTPKDKHRHADRLERGGGDVRRYRRRGSAEVYKHRRLRGGNANSSSSESGLSSTHVRSFTEARRRAAKVKRKMRSTYSSSSRSTINRVAPGVKKIHRLVRTPVKKLNPYVRDEETDTWGLSPFATSILGSKNAEKLAARKERQSESSRSRRSRRGLSEGSPPKRRFEKPGVYVRRFFKKHGKTLKPHLKEALRDLRHKKNTLLAKSKQPVGESLEEGQKVTGWIFNRTARLGVRCALKGVQLVTGLQSTQPEAEVAEESEKEFFEEYFDPFDFEVNDIEDMPVAIPKLVIKTDMVKERMGQRKNHTYFDNQKYLRYCAATEQGVSKFTRDLADRYKKGEIKPPLKEVIASLGPRIHFSLKADVEKQTLTIGIIEASNLLAMDANGFSDPYCLVSLKPDAAFTPLRTRTIGKTLNPKWKEVFELSGVPPIATLLRQVLHVEVWDWDQIGADDFIGSIDINMDRYNIIAGIDTWVELQVPKAEEVHKDIGRLLVGLRYEEGAEKLTVYMERCVALEHFGWLLLKICLHINGRLIKMIKKGPEKIVSVNPDLKRRVVFNNLRKTLMDEYTVTIYFALWKNYIWYDYFGQINLSEKSKESEEYSIWKEMKKMAGETVFKEIPLQTFIGLVRKPWRRSDGDQALGFLNLTIKSYADEEDDRNTTITCTIEKGDELALKEDTFIVIQIYLVKDLISVVDDITIPKRVGERVTPIEERFDFFVDNRILQDIGLVLILCKVKPLRNLALNRNIPLLQKIHFENVPFARVVLSLDHRRSSAEEIEMWKATVKTGKESGAPMGMSTGPGISKRLQLRELMPEIFQYSLKKSEEKIVSLQHASMLPGKNYMLGSMCFNITYDGELETLNLYVDRFLSIPIGGRMYVHAFLHDLKKSYRHRVSSEYVMVTDANPDFQVLLKLEGTQATYFSSHYLFVRLYQSPHVGFDQMVGQTVIRLIRPKD